MEGVEKGITKPHLNTKANYTNSASNSAEPQRTNAFKSHENISGRYKGSSSGNDVNSVIQETHAGALSSKDAELICEIVIDSGIDPRSLAFEILTKRVAN